MATELTRLDKERLLRFAGALGLGRGASSLPPITAVARADALPLSFAQQRLWFLAEMVGGSGAYHIAVRRRLRGPLDPRALRRALDRIVTRHEVLRTTFVLADGEPRQRIAPAGESRFHLIEEDWRGRADAEQALADRLAAEDSDAFDLEHGPLVRGRLIRLGDREHALSITMHHIVADGWSIGVLMAEMSVLYAAFVQGDEDPLPPLTIQYADYAVWQRQWTGSAIVERHEAYWKQTLAGAPIQIAVPADHARPATSGFAGGWVNVTLGERLTTALRELGRRQGATLYMTLLAGWAALLARLSGQEGLVIGSPTANRDLVEIEGLIGFFVNTLALRLDLSGSPTVAELLRRVKAQVLAAQDHQDVPFEHVVEIVQPARSPAHNPLFQVMFDGQRAREGRLTLRGLTMEPLPSPPHRTAKFDLTLSLRETGRRIEGGLEYTDALFERATVERYRRYLEVVLEAMAADETQIVGRLPLLPREERRQLLETWNDTHVAYPRDACVHELFEAQARQTPDALAVGIDAASLTYGDLNRRANQLAARLREIGVQPDTRVGICLEPSLEMVVGVLATLKAGGAYVPLDPAYPAGRLKYMVADSGVRLLLTDRRSRDLVAALTTAAPVVDIGDAVKARDGRPATNLDSGAIGLTSRHLAYVIYTSGSTGVPKGVMVEHSGLVNLALAQIGGFAVAADSRVLQFASFSFDACVFEMFMALCHGASLQLMRREDGRVGDALVERVARDGITHVTLPPAVLRELPPHLGLEPVETLIVAGEALPKAVADEWRTDRRLINAYGPTEATICATMQECAGDMPGNPPIGRPIANTRVFILDSVLEPVPIGVTGELYLAGAGVARGYLGRPDLAAERFVPDAFDAGSGARMYRTGDIGRWRADGTIEFLGRTDLQVKVRGYRVELEEIEARLRGHAAVRDAVVVARHDADGDPRLIAYYTCRDSAAPEDHAIASDLRAHLWAALPDYMVPAAYVRLTTLPLTANGKIDRQALPAPDDTAVVRQAYEAPVGPIERTVADVWAEVLRRERVSRHDNFFELGGHSLLAVRVIARLRQEGLRADVRALFATPTLAAFAPAIDPHPHVVDVPPSAIPEGCDAIAPAMLPLVSLTAEEIERIVAEVPGGAANVQDIYPLAPLQEGILFHALMSGEGDPYLVGSVYSFESRERLDAYLGALQTVIARHDILRSAVLWEGVSEPVQVVWRTAVLPIDEVTVDADAGDIAAQLYARYDPRHYRLDVRRAPLLRMAIARDAANGRWLLMQLLHHLVGDHVTLDLMQQEIEACLLGDGARLPAPLPFRNLVAQARLGIGPQDHETYFRQLLGDVAEPTAPFGLLNVRGDGTGIEEAHLKVDAGVARRLRNQARHLGVSAASVVHVAWAQVLARVAARDDVVFGTVLFGRMHGGDGSESALGLFINTLPVRLRIGDLGAVGAVRSMHEQLADLLRHEHAPLALAQRCSAVPAPAPLFSSLLNYRHGTRIVRRKQAWEGIRRLRRDVRTSYPLMFAVDDLEDGFQLTAQVERPVGAARVCAYMHTALESLVDALEHGPRRRVQTLEVLPAQERDQVLRTGRATLVAPPGESSLAAVFAAQARQAPEAVAVVYEDTCLTYDALNRSANQLAHHLRALGVGPDARVALCAERGLELIVGLLAILKAGGAYVPLDPSYPEARLRGMLADSAPVALLTHPPAQGRCSALGAALPIVDITNAACWREQPASDPDPAALGVSADHLAYVIYTSGSSGAPKGVMVSQRAVARYVAAIHDKLRLPRGAACGWISTVAADLGNTMLFPALLGGGVLHVVPTAIGTDAERFAAYSRAHRIEYLKITPSHFQALLGDGRTADAIPSDAVIFGGEVLSPSLVDAVSTQRPACRIYNHYGPTECTVGALADPVTASADPGGGPVPLGRPLGAARVAILDRSFSLVPVGVAGEIYIGGAGVARGYLQRADMTADRFVPDPFAADGGARMYRTGDVGRWLPDGRVEFFGRNDRQAKIRGYRIELEEIEARLRAHAAVRDAVVIARDEADGERRLVAYYTSGEDEAGAGIDVDALRAHLLSALPEYMVPAVFVRLATLPVTANGKVDRQALPAPEAVAAPAGGDEAPVGEVEIALARVWAEVLKRERVGRRDNFFELGGHSLLAVRVIARLRQAGIQADVGALFATPTLADLAAALDPAAESVSVPPNGIPAGCAAITPAMLPLVSLSEDDIARIVASVPGGAANVQDIYPLAPLQQGILFHALMGGDADPYLLGSLYSFESRERLDAYLHALQAVIARHDILRTAFLWEGLQEPAQVVWREAVLPVEEGAVDAGTADVATELFARYDPRRHSMDVRQAPLMRIAIARDAVGERWLLMRLQHHLVGDHTATDVMQEEIEAHLLGEEGRLPAPRPFRNLVAQARLGVSAAEHEAHFRQLLGDVTEPTAPFGLLNVRGDREDMKVATLRLEADLGERLREQARRLGVSAASVCHVAWAQVLARVSERADVVFGTVVFGRMHGGEGSEQALGLFMNTLPVRLAVDGAGAAATVRGMHAQLATLLRHEHAPLALAQRCSAVPAPAPLFSSLLNYRYGRRVDAAARAARRQAWQGVRRIRGEARTNYPVTLSVDDLGDGFQLIAQVTPAVSAAQVVAYMQTALTALVDTLAEAPARAVGTLAVLPVAERAQILDDWNATRVVEEETCVHQRVEAQVRRTPDAVAVVAPDGSTLTYRALNERANQLARQLRRFGVGPDARVAICAERSVELVVGLLAIQKAGGAYVPLDPSHPDERLQQMLTDSTPAALLVPTVLAGRFAGWTGALPVVELAAAPPESDHPTIDLDAARIGVTADHLAYVMYTSGSTGTPKGVMVPHRAIGRLLVQNGYATFTAADRVAFVSNPAFDASTLELWAPLVHGGAIVIVPPAVLLEPERFGVLLQQQAVDILSLTAGLFNQYADLLPDTWARLRCLIVGGDVVDRRVVARVQRRGGPTQLLHAYGPTETTLFATTHAVTGAPDPEQALPIGRPITNTRVYVLNAAGEPVAVGVAGELYIGGTGVARGYLDRAALTAERFVVDPFAPERGARMYRTGDRARWRPDGTIEFLGRTDFQVKIRGFRIELGEIAATLVQHAGIREAVVLARDEGGARRLAAYYEREPGQAEDLGAEELRAYLVQKLPDYMVPAAYVRVERWPLTPHGKLDRQALPAPDADAYGAHGDEAPQGEVETQIAAIWADVLQVPRVGRHDDFFAIGGHSLVAVRVMARLRQAGLPVDVRALFATPTVATLAAAIEPQPVRVEVPPNGIPAGCTEITPAMLPLVSLSEEDIARIVASVPGGAENVQDIYPLAPLQEGILFHALLEGAGDPYLLARLTSFDSRARLDAYLDALQAVIARHDILRTAVVWEGLSEPVQVVWRHAPVPIDEVTLDDGADDVARALYARYDPRHVRLDVRQAPLLRLAVAWDPKAGRWLLMQRLHHLAGDHVTLELTNEEIEAHLLGEAARLPAPRPFRNLVAEARRGVPEAEHEAYFRRLLGDVTEPTAPFGLLNVRGDGTGVDEARLEVEADLARRLQAQARQLGVSAASVFHVAWALVLARLSGRADVVFGTVLFGRMEEGAERTLGLFINMLPVRLRVDADGGAARAVRGAHQQLAALLRHEHAPLALAQRCSAVPAPLPLFSSMLNYRHTQPRRRPAGTGIRPLRGEVRTSYPLMFAVDDRGNGFGLTAQVAATVAAARVCAYMHTAVASLVDALEREPERRVRTLEVLPAAERQQIVEAWNPPRDVDVQAGVPLAAMFEAQVRRTPDAPALVFEDTCLTYAALNRRANQLANRLRRLGVQPDTCVAICADRSLELVIGLLATAKAGGAYVPLDPGYPVARLQAMIADSAPVAVLTYGERTRVFDGAGARVPVVDLAERSIGSDAPAIDPDHAALGLTPDHMAYVIYTSGSTGTPKGVMVSHGALTRYVAAIDQRLGLTPGCACGWVSTAAADLGHTMLFPALLRGGVLHVVPTAISTDAERFAAYNRAHALDYLKITPSHFHALLGDGRTAGAIPARGLVFGGEVLSASLVAMVHALRPDCHIYNHYGPTECTVGAVSAEMDAEAVVATTGVMPLGHPLGHVHVTLLDASLNLVPANVDAEIYIGGAGVARGYLRRPELTADRFVPDPFGAGGARVYRTGDVGRWRSDGTIDFLGRADRQVKIRGYRIELEEIEAGLRAHAHVQDAVVVVHGSDDGRRLIAYYTCGDEQARERLDADALRTHLAAALPEYMVPAVFVRLDTLPLTANGKVDRQALPAPDAIAATAGEYEPPIGEVESALARVWADVLKRDRVSRRDNFFELGGHSLLAVRVIARLRQAGMQADVGALFATPTLADLAAAIEPHAPIVEVPPNGIRDGCTAITPAMLPLVSLTAEQIERIVAQVPGGAANVQDIYPLAPLQEGLLFHVLMAGVGDPYLIARLYSFESRERLDAYVGALRAVIARHDILRTAVVWEGVPEPVQVVWRHAPLPVEEVVVEAAAADVSSALYARLDPRHVRLDLRQAPLLRVAIARDEAHERWLLMRVQHHLIGDHVTTEVIQEEVEAHLLGEETRLPASQPFRNLVAQARLGLSAAEHEAYFRSLLGDVAEPTAPFGLSNVRGDGAGIEEVRIDLDAGVARRLRDQARQLGVSAASLFHVAWAQVLARVSGRGDPVFGTVLFGRMQGGEGSERVLGLFINTLPVRLQVSNDGAVGAVRRTHRHLAELLRHEHAPLALAQRCSAVPAPAPLFSSILNYRHSRTRRRAAAWAGIRRLRGEVRTSYPLAFAIDDRGEAFGLMAQAERSVGAAQVCGYMQTAVASLVDALEHDPSRRVRTLEVLPASEREQWLATWHEPPAAAPLAASLAAIFEAQVRRTPEAIAVVFDETRLTYDVLNRRANQLAHHLRGLGVRPDTRVAICAERGLELVIGLLAILKAGGAYVPLDPGYPVERLRGMVTDSASVALLTQRGLAHAFEAISAQVPALDLAEDAAWREAPASDPDPATCGLTPDHLAYVIYTSGSTGGPKGVMVSHRSVMRYVAAIHDKLGMTAGAACGWVSTVAADLGNTMLFPALLGGGVLHVVPAAVTTDADRFASYCGTHRLEYLKITPSHFHALLGDGRTADAIPARGLIFGGEVLSASLVATVHALRPACRIYNHYGPTECTVGAVSDEMTTWPASANGAVPLGRSLGHVRVALLDTSLNLVPAGAEGEIYIGGTGVTRGYLERPDLTAERFVPDPCAPEGGARMYQTGDRGRWLGDGTITFLGRTDRQVKIRGYRIELEEIEARLRAHAAVRDAVVVVREEPDGARRLVAYVVPEAEAAYPLLEALRLAKTGALPPSRYELPNDMLVSHQNTNETEYLYREIFERQTYLQHGLTLRDDACVFDVGANIGLFTLFALERAPRATVYAFEPIPAMCDDLRLNTRLSGGSVRVFNCGLAGSAGAASFTWFRHNSLISGRYVDLQADTETIKAFVRHQGRDESLSDEALAHVIAERLAHEAVTCPLRTLSEVIATEGVDRIDLLKIDAQRSELEILEGLEARDWAKIDQLVVEVHDIEGRLATIQRALAAEGFHVGVEQEVGLETTEHYTLYARRRECADAAVAPSPLPAARRYWSASQLWTALRGDLSVTLPEYMVPAVCVPLETLPLTANGKVDRRALPAPETDAERADGYEAPVGDVETTVARVWADVLKRDRIGRHDDFFALGGHSLLAVRVIARLRQAGIQADVRALFATPTLADLAAALEPHSPIIEVPPNGIPAGCATITPAMLPLVSLTADEIARIVACVPGGAANVQDIYPLAPLQEGLLFHALMSEDGDPYLSGSLYSFESEERLHAYLQALQAVIARHDILRTAIVWEDLPEPVQVVWRQAVLPVEHVTLTSDAGDVGAQLHARYDPRHCRLDVRQAPLLRVAVAWDDAQRRWLLMKVQHHLVGDHVTTDAIREEVEAHLLGEEARLPAPQPFRTLLAQARLGLSAQAHEAYFRQLLGDVEEPTAPFGLLDVRGDRQDIETATLRLEVDLAERLRQQARALGVSAASICHVAWAQVLARVSARDDVVFGTVLFGRMGGEGAEKTLGLFMNTLPVRLAVGGEGAARAVREMHAQLAELLRHEHASLALAQRCSAVPAPTPLFSSLLNYRHSQRAALRRPARDGVRRIRGEARTNYPVTLSVDDVGDGFLLTARVAHPGAASRVCAYMQTALAALVDALAHAPARPLRALQVLPAAERRQVLETWNDTQTAVPGEVCLHALIEAQVRQTPDALAVVFGDAALTYDGLNRRANQLAHHLRGLGVRPDTRVAVCLGRRLELVVGLVGVMKAGGAYVPLDPTYPRERVQHMLADSAPAAVLTCGARPEWLREDPALPVVDLADHGASWRTMADTELEAGALGLTPQHLAYVIYTSGSTGRPKGVMVTHGGLTHYMRWAARAYTPARAVVSSSVSFDGTVTSLYTPLLGGGTIRLVPEGAEIDGLYAELQMPGCGLVKATPSHLAALGHRLRAEHGASRADLLVVGGEALPPAMVQVWRELDPQVRIVNQYGPTETVVACVAYEVPAEIDGTASVPIGRPIANTQIYILDGAREPVPVGVAGELYIGGVQVTRGYLHRPELTAERFVSDPFGRVPGGRLYRTGDVARWRADGTIEFLGRNDFQVKIRGYRIELEEIEARLRTHAGVRDAVVVARDIDEDVHLVAYYTPADEASQAIDAEALRAHLAATLPPYTVPAAYVRLAALPTTANGKLDRRALPAPDDAAYGARGYEAPVGEIETAVAAIWAEVLQRERIGRRDDFFALGGHSLLAVRVMTRLRQAGLPVDVRALFATPTVATLAAAIQPQPVRVAVPPNGIPEGCTAITPAMLPLVALTADEIDRIVGTVPGGAANVQDIYPLAPLQEGILFHALVAGAGDPYLQARLTSFDSRARLDAYKDALQAVIARHDILRTAVVWEGLPEPVQVVWRHAPVPIDEVTLEDGADDVASALYARYDPRHVRLDLRQAPLLRVAVAWDPAAGRWLLMQRLHHLAGDQVTLDVMNEEIEAHLVGEAARLPAPRPFRNLVAETRRGLPAAEHEAYFRQLVGDVTEPTAPFGLLNVRGDGTGIDEARLAVDTDLARRLRAHARALGVSAASVFHVAWAQVLARVSGRDDVVFGTVLFGRMEEGAERTLGLFINTLPVRLCVGDEGAARAVRGTHQQLAALLRHEHAPLTLAQRCSAVPAPTPLFSSLLNYRHRQRRVPRPSAQTKRRTDTRLLRKEGRTNYPVTLSIDDRDDEFMVTAQVQRPVEAQRVCAYLQTALTALADALEREPGRPLRSLDVLPAAERQLLHGWNDTAAAFPHDTCLPALCLAPADETPDAVAVVYDETCLTYRELHRRASQVAQQLRALGVRPDARVAIAAERSLELVVGMFGILQAGGAYVPLDLTYPAARLQTMLEDSAPVALLTRGSLPNELSALAADRPVIDLAAAPFAVADARAEEAAPVMDLSELTPDHLAYVIYTSGSTGTPKGAMVAQRSIVNRLTWMQRAHGLARTDTVLQKTPITFDVSVWELCWPLMAGARLVMARPDGHKDPAYLLETIERHRITTTHFVPSMFEAFLDQVPLDGCPTLARVVCSGEALTGRVAARAQASLPSATLYNLYGPTEAAVEVTAWTGAADPHVNVPIGRPIANVQIHLLARHGAPTPVGVAGELHIGGVQVARGYLRRPELTAERFVPDPCGAVPGGRLYCTGDLARWRPDGMIEYLGRNDSQVKLRGQRIELGEIEARLRAHATVRDAVVVVTPTRDGDARLVAYYTIPPEAADAAIGAEALRAHLAAALPDYMLPAAYVRLATLPFTTSGKVDRKALPAPDAAAYAAGGYEAPDGPLETALAAIWAEVLDVDRVGRHDNFFRLGGHSLLAMTLVERMRQRGFAVDVGALFERPTIAELTLALDAAAEIVSVPGNRIPEIRTPHHSSSQIEVRI